LNWVSSFWTPPAREAIQNPCRCFNVKMDSGVRQNDSV
jgi:hypothetical protein